MKNVVILISGRGSNMVSLIKAMAQEDYPAKCVLVVSNNPKAEGINKANELGVKTSIINHRDFSTREEHERKIVETIKEVKGEIVCLAGYMRLLSPYFVNEFKNKILNIHPALLPSFPGLDVQKKALEWGVRFTGCTVHIVDEDCDNGPILLQAVVPIFPNDTVQTISDRILKYEHKIYPLSLKLFCEDKFTIEGRRAILKIDDDEYLKILKEVMWNWS